MNIWDSFQDLIDDLKITGYPYLLADLISFQNPLLNMDLEDYENDEISKPQLRTEDIQPKTRKRDSDIKLKIFNEIPGRFIDEIHINKKKSNIKNKLLTMATDEAQIKPLTILTIDCQTFASENDDILPSSTSPTSFPYSIIKVKPTEDGQDISEITGCYIYGLCSDEKVLCEFKELELTKVFKCQSSEDSDSLFTRIHKDFVIRSAAQKDQVLKDSSYPGETELQKWTNTFSGSVAVTLCTFAWMMHDQKSICNPFGPIDPCFPPCELSIYLLNQSIFRYVRYIIDMIKCIDPPDLDRTICLKKVCSCKGKKNECCLIGRLWGCEIERLYCIWFKCFPCGPKLKYEVAIYCAIQGFACYFSEKKQKVVKKIKEFDQKVYKACDLIQGKVNEALKTIEEAHNKAQTNGKNLLNTISTSREAAEDSISNKQTKAVEEITKTHQDRVSKLRETGDQINKSIIHSGVKAKNAMNKTRGQMLESMDLHEAETDHTLTELHKKLVKSISSVKIPQKKAMIKYAQKLQNQLDQNHHNNMTKIQDRYDTVIDKLGSFETSSKSAMESSHENFKVSVSDSLEEIKTQRKSTEDMMKTFYSVIEDVDFSALENLKNGDTSTSGTQKDSTTDENKRIAALEKQVELLTKTVHNLINNKTTKKKRRIYHNK